MAGDSDSKTKEQLIEEINALKEQLAAHDTEGSADTSSSSHQPTLAKPMTRREALSNWIAPVVLSVPVMGAIKPETANAQPVPPTPPAPTPMPPAPTVAVSVDTIGTAGAVALGGALAAAGAAKLVKDKKKTSDNDGSKDEADRR